MKFYRIVNKVVNLSLRILLIENSKSDAEAILSEIKQGGYEVIAERVETRSAMQKALVRHPWDVILCEYSLPRFSAMDALALLEENSLAIPLIVVSGSIGEEAAVALLKAGASDFVLKGTWTRLIPAITGALERTRRVGKKQGGRETPRMEKELARILEYAAQAIIAVNENQEIFLFNQAAEKTFGYLAREVLGKPLDILIPHRLAAIHRKHVRNFAASPVTSRPIEERQELVARRKDGSEFPVEIGFSKLEFDGRPVFTATIVDVSEHKREEEALRQMQERFQALTENAPDGILLIDRDGQGMYISPAGRKMLGFGRDEDPSINLAEYVHPNDLPRVFSAISSLIEDPSQHPTLVHRLRHREGIWLWVESTFTNLLKVKSIEAIVINFRDITERKKAEENLQRQLERLNTLHTVEQAVTSSTDLNTILGLFVRQVIEQLHVDAVSILLLNEQTQKLEYATGEGFRTNALRYTNLDLGNGLAGKAARGQKIIKIPNLVGFQDNPILAKAISGEDFTAYLGVPLIAKGQLCGVMEIFQRSAFALDSDWLTFIETLTGQAAIAIDHARLFAMTQAHLRETEALYRVNQGLATSIEPLKLMKDVVTLLQRSFGYYYVQIYVREPDSDDFVVRAGSGLIGKKMVNQEYRLASGEGIIGYTAETGVPFYTNNVDEVISFTRHPLLRETKSQLAVPIRIGKHILGLLDIHQVPPLTLTQRDVQLVSAVADQLAVALQKAQLYTDLQNSLQQEKEARAQLIHSEKLAVVGRLLASVSHEMNNPLQAIQNALYLLDGESRLSLKGRRNLNIVLSEADRMAAMFERLRATYQPIRAEDFQPTLINSIIEDVHALMATHLRHAHITFEFRADPILPPVPGSSDQLRQVIINLFMNATDAMEDGGHLTVSSEFLSESYEALICVADTGMGIDAAILPHVFEPFVTDKEKGTGLGLAISSEIVSNHGGRMTAENRPEGGAIFRVWLPVILEGGK
jgi:PAS domain S-box-containing protein